MSRQHVFRKRTVGERIIEILPGTMTWVTLIVLTVYSFIAPTAVSVFVILFDLYWLFKSVNSAAHLLSAYRDLRRNIAVDWAQKVEALGTRNHWNRPWTDFYHLVVYPFSIEGEEVLETTLNCLAATNYPLDRIMVVLAVEERLPQGRAVAEKMREKYGKMFFKFFITEHPDGLAGEIRGKSANTSWAVRQVVPQIDQLGISRERVIISNFDSDSCPHEQYFGCLMHAFLTEQDSLHASYQPIPVFNNNIWDSPSFMRVIAAGTSFWHLIESSRPDRLRTFSSHSMSLKTLVEVGNYKTDVVNEDSCIFWQCYFHYNGNYRTVPLFIPLSMDTVWTGTYARSLVSQYKQKRRWAYNVEYFPWLLNNMIHRPIRLFSKFVKTWQYVEGNFTWATAPIIISLNGWLPLIYGGRDFSTSVLFINLPLLTRTLMISATAFLILSVYINLLLLPPRPKKYGVSRTVSMYLQWIVVPIISVVFGAVPAIDSQTRLILGKYMEFWVTPKSRSNV